MSRRTAPLLHLSNPVGQGEPVIKQKRRIGCEAGGGQRRIGGCRQSNVLITWL
jgi:hypothetical protein